MKGWVSLNSSQKLIIENAGWLDVEETQKPTNDYDYFDLSIPLCVILGFAEDYRKILVNVKHELILTSSRNDIDTIVQTAVADNTYEEFKIELTMKIEWLMSYVFLSDKRKIPLINYIDKNRPVVMSYHSWEFSLHSGDNHTSVESSFARVSNDIFLYRGRKSDFKKL